MEEIACEGQWVQIQIEVLTVEQRFAQLPEDTRKVPLVLKVKGFLENERARMGDAVSVKTAIGRRLQGTLVAVNPPYEHNFGRAIPELLAVGDQLQRLLGPEKELG